MKPHIEAATKTAAIALVVGTSIIFPVLFGIAGLTIVLFGWLSVMIGSMIYMMYKSFLFKAEMRKREEETQKRWDEIYAKRKPRMPAK